ncbi:secreted RxLR effector protein 161-like [Rhagoletis pomonella]|uniref:secreted RxLR effector protein 161-like n=1 Tax=Rhagoletis pomonella TaxID=28610 RepID=UPI001785AE4F|nr:secreted RxLR effector protein 161-like [Rhagoletis pomonella]
MKDIGEVSSVLGIRVTKDELKGMIAIDQSQYIEGMLERFSMADCNPVATPIDLNQNLSSNMCPTNEIEKHGMAKVPYMQAIGCLLFASQITRSHICFAVNLLSRFSTNPGKAHWTAIKRVMRYLKVTMLYGLVFNKEASDITGFCDADWGSDLDEKRSTTGYIFQFQGSPISWCTRRQRTVALSSIEAEFMSLTAAIQEATVATATTTLADTKCN